MSETPRTNKIREAMFDGNDFDVQDIEYLLRAHEQLERELVAAREDVERLRALHELGWANRDCPVCGASCAGASIKTNSAREDALEEDLAAMIRRLSYALKRAGGNDKLVMQSVELLKRHNLGGEVMREMNENNAAQAAKVADPQVNKAQGSEAESSHRPDRPAESASVLDAMVDRFLAWPLPVSVCSDACVTRRQEHWEPQRIGTNLLTADEARQMLQYVLSAAPASGYELHVQFKTADLPKKQPSIIPDSGPSEADIRGALARGYCTPENSHKVLDFDLINAIVSEILRLRGGK